MTGRFYRLEATSHFPEHLAGATPEVLWLPSILPFSTGDVVLLGHPLGENSAAPVPLVSLEANGALRAHFSVGDTIRAILLEEYHSGLQPTIEMKLPFNYSLVPNWMKGVARGLLSERQNHRPPFSFPPPAPGFTVEWLRKLQSAPRRDLWPQGKRAAAIITHDVDTGWIFRHDDWLEKICDVEEKYDFRGAWYCVPRNSEDAAAERAISRLIDRGCEVGVHGYNHDAKWPLLEGSAFDKRLDRVRQFAGRWGAKGFRSEWLFRTPRFLQTLARVFRYDSSVPSHSRYFTSNSANGCSSCFPYRTHGGLLELPVSLPMDEARHGSGLSVEQFWWRQIEISRQVARLGGLIVLSLHPQPHQAANKETIDAVDTALGEITSDKEIWIARPYEVADRFAQQDPA